MEANDRNLILELLERDSNLKRLYLEHEELEQQLEEYNGRSFLTADEEMEEKRLKKMKLHGVDRMMAILYEHRVSAAA